MQPLANQYLYFPNWVSKKAMYVCLALLFVSSIAFSGYTMQWFWILIAIVETFSFFYIAPMLSRQLCHINNTKRFEKRVFWIGFGVRFAYMIIMYWVFMENYGDSFGFDNADSRFYNDLGKHLASQYRLGNFNIPVIIDRFAPGTDLSDMGYGTYLSFLYLFTDDSIVFARIAKCALSAYTVILIYRLATRNFGERVAKLAVIFCMFAPNLIYYCGVHIKEVEMVFLSVLFVEQADYMLRSKQFTAWKIIPLLLIVAALFTFRTPLAIVCILSLLFSITMTSTKIIGWGKRIVIAVLALLMVGATMGNRIYEEASSMIERVSSGEQQGNMEWRTRRGAKGVGNQFAKYAGAAVFAPMIFTIPFPTMVETPTQEIQRIHLTGNYVKNILSGFVILSVLVLVFSGDWRKHLVPLSFMLGYLAVLVMSTFAQAERFHQPVQSLELMFAAYGISLCGKRERKWFNWWMIFMFVVILFWQWFKLKGKGLI